jgi:hypothetical protein
MKSFFAAIGILIFCSCSKSGVKDVFKEPEIIPVPVQLTDAAYSVSVTTYWSAPAFTVPANVHLTTLSGMIHKADTFLWKTGIIATDGLKDVAEIGNSLKINKEIDSIIGMGRASLRFDIPPPAINSTVQKDLMFTPAFSQISFVSMIAPSPDWFIGIHNLSLISGNKWIADTTVNIYVYDSGTEEGDVFGYNNPATLPRQNVGVLMPANATVLANGNTVFARMASIRFVKN